MEFNPRPGLTFRQCPEAFAPRPIIATVKLNVDERYRVALGLPEALGSQIGRRMEEYYRQGPVRRRWPGIRRASGFEAARKMARRPVQYDLSDYHDDGTLRVSGLIIASILFLSRHLLLILVSGISTFKGADISGIPGLYSHPLLLMASIPALLVLVALFRRITKAGALPRTIWRAGRWLLCLAATLDIALALVLADFRVERISAIHIAALVADAYIVVYLLRSERARDTFADFPAPRVQGSRGQHPSRTRE